MAYIPNHPDYDDTLPDVKKVRAAVQGEPEIKRGASTYLPHPSMVDKLSTSAKERYNAYLTRAEFDSSCSQTKIELLGAFKYEPHTIDLPDVVKYLDSDSDGDALSLSDSINVTASNILEAKFHILLAEFEDGGISGTTTVAQLARVKQRAKIVHYPREALTNWEYSKVNGRVQLSKACLTTEDVTLDDDFNRKVRTKHLILGLDESGFYYQKLIITEQDKPIEVGDPIPISAKGKRLDYIPLEIVVDEKGIPGELPKACGYLYPIASKDVSRYQVNADLKEKLAVLQDTVNSFGWTEADWEAFKKINGRDYIATGVGVSNVFPKDVTVDVLKLTTDGDAHFRYIELNQEQTRALGGRLADDAQADKTATEAKIRSARENAILTSIAESIEQAYRKLVMYCCQFEGVIIDHNEIKIDVNRQFSSSKLSVEDVRGLIEVRDARGITEQTFVKLVKQGGFGDDEETIEEIIETLEQEIPDPADQSLDNPESPQQVAA